MTCPKCGGRTSIKDTAYNHKDREVYRKRECCDCHYVIYTMEYEIEPNEQFIRDWNKYWMPKLK